MCQPLHLGHSLPLSCEITSAHPKWAPLNALVGGRLSAEQVEGLWSCPSWAPSYMEDQESRPRCVTWAVEFESGSTAGPSLLGNNCGHQLTSKLQRSKRCTEEQRIVTVRALAVWQRRRRSGRTEGLPLPPPRSRGWTLRCGADRLCSRLRCRAPSRVGRQLRNALATYGKQECEARPVRGVVDKPLMLQQEAGRVGHGLCFVSAMCAVGVGAAGAHIGGLCCTVFDSVGRECLHRAELAKTSTRHAWTLGGPPGLRMGERPGISTVAGGQGSDRHKEGLGPPILSTCRNFHPATSHGLFRQFLRTEGLRGWPSRSR